MIHLLSPGAPDQRTGGYRYNARLVAELRTRGHAVTVHELGGDWPFPRESDVAEGVENVRDLEGQVVADGLLWTALAPGVTRPVTALVHSPLWREHGPDARTLEEAALARADAVVCTSARIRDDLDLVGPVTVVEPGTDPAPATRRPGTGALLCVANVMPRKGHDVLLEAIREVGVPVSLRCAGTLPDDAYGQQLVAASRDLPIRWLGSLDPADLERELANTDLLVQAAHYEGFGMAIAEALVRGIPVVSPPAGVLDGRRGGHRLVPPGDSTALAAAIRELVSDTACVDRLATEARALDLPTWSVQANRWEHVLRRSP